MTEMFTEYSKLQESNATSRRENERLTDCLNGILKELNDRAPVIEQLKQDYDNARFKIDQLTNECQALNLEKQKVCESLNSKSLEFDALVLENKSLVQETRDLAKQVYTLTFQISQGDQGPGNQFDDDVDFQESAANKVISERLVSFNNVQELVSQNQVLRRSLRSLSSQIEEYQNSTENSDLKSQLTQCQELIKELTSQLELQSTKVDSFSRERDQWRRIAEGRNSRSASPNLRPLTPTSTSEETQYESLYNQLLVYEINLARFQHLQARNIPRFKTTRSRMPIVKKRTRRFTLGYSNPRIKQKTPT